MLRDRKVGSLRKVRAKLRSEGIDLSRTTIIRVAHREGLRSAVPIPKPKLTPEHRAARLAWVEAHKNDDEQTIRKLVFTDEKKFAVCDASHRVWLLPYEPTPIRETRKYHACFALSVFAVLHTQHTACCLPSLSSSSSSSSFHAACLIITLFMCCCAFSCVVGKFAATVSISAVITSYGAASCVVLEPNTALNSESYRDLLKESHIPVVRTKFPDNDFVWIQVDTRQMLFFRFLFVVCTHYIVWLLVVGGVSRITLRFTLHMLLVIGWTNRASVVMLTSHRAHLISI
jgi:hypothetical protein